MANFIDKEYNRQKKLFHSSPFNYGKEMSHTWGKIGVFLGCSRFIVAGERNHHKNLGFIASMRELTKEDKLKMNESYIKGIGCKGNGWDECNDCLIRKEYLKYKF
jgi:hypothetical protein